MSSASYDLHTHSTYSDGTLCPAAVVQCAAAAGVRCLALSDHDELAGLAEARREARQAGIDFVPGVEISVTWQAHTLHVIGLHIDPDHGDLRAGLSRIREGRHHRAQRIAQGLERVGITGSLDGARAYADNPDLVSRTHFARYLVDQGYVRNLNAAFRRFLGSGAPGHVAHHWATLEEAVNWIRASGGLAVLAHPARYRVDPSQRDALLASFRELGGAAIEVVSGNHDLEHTALWGRYAVRFGLLASAGSDFHGLAGGRNNIGRLPPVPAGPVPVWTKF
jgi:predicted metal-dependent phosphoesterase TrpH